MRQTTSGHPLTIQQAAQRLGLSHRTVQTWIWKGKIEHFRINGWAVRIDPAVIDKLLAESKIPARGGRQ
jgi:excisionase family DNA binding protein